MANYSMEKLQHEMMACRHAILKCRHPKEESHHHFFVLCEKADNTGGLWLTCDDAGIVPFLTGNRLTIPVRMKFADREKNLFFTLKGICNLTDSAANTSHSTAINTLRFKVQVTEVRYYEREVHTSGISFLFNTTHTVFT